MKIYTKTGDSGLTSLIGGVRIAKHNARIEAYGTVDELNAHIGLLRDHNQGHLFDVLIEIQDRLFTLGSHLAAHPEKSKMKLPEIFEEDVIFLEKEIDAMNEQLPEMRAFVLPGGNVVVSYTHIARCVCRRAERCVSFLSSNEMVEPIIGKYLNRLSDYLFVLSRFIGMQNNALEVVWKPRHKDKI
ncbi:MAG: cob(I)yrinic acid a,c-diamide adenosyltransferase [Bacteroidia bacterium]|nr:cob(I)yrinic acid a,c-diamide adenosyltransferase [Bacteroidia bacterium]